MIQPIPYSKAIYPLEPSEYETNYAGYVFETNHTLVLNRKKKPMTICSHNLDSLCDECKKKITQVTPEKMLERITVGRVDEMTVDRSLDTHKLALVLAELFNRR